MGFLPAGASAPKQESNYLKLIEGSIKFRVVSPALVGYEYWNISNKPVRLKDAPKEKPSDIRLNDDGSYTVKYFWAFSVLDRGTGKVMILEITQSGVMRQLQDLLENADWGEPTAYDITITGKGDGLNRRYTVQPSPHKELTKEEKSLVARMEVNLEALFQGGNPFEDAPKIVEPEEDILDAVPF